ncbi:cobyric acid synthase [Halovenus sp. WSH3]|uniref:Probable cobyric acid synthase n=1 Tax=Halovenus carboxidivorans TaxID=2692199 RepID=A0A6B0T406_9EURY|nr:cobyric acid synthase [Halovenus carboxidivorans]MXR50012.1 cobyric acid synthase [Halovenus carboxidivorans]
MTETVLIAGTASHVGKSTVAAGLCRALARRGVSVAPYKAQNMSNNARVVVSQSGDWGEIGVAQYVQATAAEVTPTTDLNPVLLKPRGDGESQLVIQGEATEHVGVDDYYDDHWERAREAAVDSYRRLAADHDVIVAEGAGSIAEINLHDRDLANVETAEFADAEILVVVDIERGGAFASLYGTLELLPDRLHGQVAGAVITKFRGDRSLLEPGIEEIEDRTGVPVLGVIPYDDPGLPAEDSISIPDRDERGVVGGDDVADERTINVGVPRLPRISNFTDLDPLAREPGVRVVYLPLDGSLSGIDGVVVPGSKNTVDDLLALRESGFDDRLRAFDGPIVGLCGGFQILGERITNAGIESTAVSGTVEAVGLLPVETRFSADKRLERTTRTLSGVGPLAGGSGTVSGYEIHMGRSTPTESVERPLGGESVGTERVLGTYVHGLFENDNARSAFVERVFEAAGRNRPEPEARRDDRSPYDRAADLVTDNVDLGALGLGEPWSE